jgi:hypothetical protein
MARYANLNEVRSWLRGKVRIDETDTDDNKMGISLFKKIVDQAEEELHIDLSPRYAFPFATDAGGEFKTLPEATQRALRVVAELVAAVNVLETDFGEGSVADASKYAGSLRKRYDKLVGKLLQVREVNGEKTQQWAHPPLPGLMLAAHNEMGDDGFMGSVISTSRGDGDYPAKQINDPSESFFTGAVDE